MEKIEAKGFHALIDLDDCDPILLSDPNALKKLLETAAYRACATVMYSVGYRVGGLISEKGTPDGVSVYVGLDESHISCHTYAREGLIALDIFTCGVTAKPKLAVEYILNSISHKNRIVKYVDRFFKNPTNEPG